MTELFLVAITVITAMIKGDDKAPALVYCLVASLFYQLAQITNNDAQIFIMGAIFDVVVIALLVCLNGCLRSKITYFLIPLSLLSIVMHFWGWTLYHKKAPLDDFNSVVVFYSCVIVALFISRMGNGDTNWHSRFLRRDNSGDADVGVVSK
jgi:hypothetical protein